MDTWDAIRPYRVQFKERANKSDNWHTLHKQFETPEEAKPVKRLFTDELLEARIIRYKVIEEIVDIED